ncbi:hypothetical protein L6R53_14225 [Myxococcota bacterium]|nr:hypothetical protein [Myxococcota bacterium]
MDLRRAVAAGLVLASGCSPIPDLWPEAAEACQEIDQTCQDKLAEHFGSEIQDELVEGIYLRGVRWMVRWDIDAAQVDHFDRAPGEGLTQRVYNYLAHKVRRSVDGDMDDLVDVDIRGHTAYAGVPLYYNGLPDDPYCCGSIPKYLLDDILYPDKDAMIDIFGAAFDACVEGVPEEFDGECFSWWGFSEHYDYDGWEE